MSHAETLSFFLLTCAICLLWYRTDVRQLRRSAWVYVLVLACIAGLYAGILDWLAIAVILILGTSARYAATTTGVVRHFFLVIFTGLAVFAGFHLLPGFSNPRVLDNIQFAADSAAFTLYFNFDKALVGLFIVAFLHSRVESIQEFGAVITKSLPVYAVTLVVVILTALLMGYIQFQAKFRTEMLYWLWANLFFTCLAEEAFFRGLIQSRLSEVLQDKKTGTYIPIFVSAILFGVAHYSGGITYVLLASIAGVGYGLVYQITGRIEASIFCHFAVNLVHIMLFSYPYKLN